MKRNRYLLAQVCAKNAYYYTTMIISYGQKRNKLRAIQ